jgi:hypothetical protein
MTLCSLTITIAGLLLKIAYTSLIMDTETTIQSTGFGVIKPGAMLDIGLPSTGITGLMANVLLANLPQLVFSCLYLLYNGLFTSMCLAHEYSSYSVCRKALRVTSPRGVQRSTHWLHLPYTYSVPLLAASSLLHWSISQSIFFVGIDVYGNPGGLIRWSDLDLASNQSFSISSWEAACSLSLSVWLFENFRAGFRLQTAIP